MGPAPALRLRHEGHGMRVFVLDNSLRLILLRLDAKNARTAITETAANVFPDPWSIWLDGFM